MNTCTRWLGDAYCGAPNARRFLPGWRCPACTPAALAGRPEVTPDPARTLAGLRKAAGLPVDYTPPISTSTLNDQRAIASGKRRAPSNAYRAAREAEDMRKKARR